MGLWAVGGGARVLSPGERLLWGEWLALRVPPEGLGRVPSSPCLSLKEAWSPESSCLALTGQWQG